MILYDSSFAPNPRRVRIFLAEKGVEVPIQQIDIGKAENRQSPYIDKNPLAGLPMLELDDGACIAESVAICRYFEELHPEPALFGRGAAGRAKVEMWNRRVEQGLFTAITYVFRHLNPKMAHLEVPQVESWGEANKPKVYWMLGVLDDVLGRHPYIAGNEYSIADITALVAIDFMKPARLEWRRGHANVVRWHAEVSARPSAEA